MHDSIILLYCNVRVHCVSYYLLYKDTVIDRGSLIVCVCVCEPVSGGLGSSASSTSGTESRSNAGCQRSTFSSGISSGGFKDDRNL